eukprot:12297186-Ditylum_brightwellii.AAC.2
MASSSSTTTDTASPPPPPPPSSIFHSIPSTLFYHSIIPYLPISNLLSLRVTCHACHSLLHNDDDTESEE